MAAKTTNNTERFNPFKLIKESASKDLDFIRDTIAATERKQQQIRRDFFGEKGVSIVGKALMELHRQSFLPEIDKRRGEGKRANPLYQKSYFNTSDIMDAIDDNTKIGEVLLKEAVDEDLLFEALEQWAQDAQSDETPWILSVGVRGIGRNHHSLNLAAFLSDTPEEAGAEA